MIIAGLDDAGRGSVIGPLVIAGVSIDESLVHRLVKIGVKDSKCLVSAKRREIAAKILKIIHKSHIEKLPPAKIDQVVLRNRKLHKLNRLEACTMARIIDNLEPEKAYVDASDVLEERYGKHILEASSFKTEIVSEHKADIKYPIVSAASIIAKVERDDEIEKLKETYGDFGSGYPSDPRTIDFLRSCLKNSNDYPDIVRRSWKTARNLKSEKGFRQTRLT